MRRCCQDVVDPPVEREPAIIELAAHGVFDLRMRNRRAITIGGRVHENQQTFVPDARGAV